MPDNPLQITHMVDHSDPLFLAEVNWSNLAVAKANARLIAAAPELLDALQGMVKEFGFDRVHNGMVHDEYMAIIAAQDAIAKATGEA